MSSIQISSNSASELQKAQEILEVFDLIDEKAELLKHKIGFYTAKDVQALTGWSMPVVQELFNRPDFPISDYGRAKVVFIPAFCEYFMKPVKRSDFTAKYSRRR